MKQLELKKHGKTKYNVCWVYGTITDTDDVISYTGIVQFKEEYNLVDGSIYQVKELQFSLNKKNVLQILVALK